MIEYILHWVLIYLDALNEWVTFIYGGYANIINTMSTSKVAGMTYIYVQYITASFLNQAIQKWFLKHIC